MTGTTDLDDYEIGDTAYVYGSFIQEEPEPENIERFRLKIYLGAIVGWCQSRYNFAGYRILYWKVVNFIEKITKVLIVMRKRGYWSGFRHGWRGLHWRRSE